MALARSTSIMDLNDKCLRKVSSYLKLVDLCAIVDVWGRFGTVAAEFFKSVAFYDSRHGRIPWKEVKNIMSKFGPMIEELRLDCPIKFHAEIIDLVTRYCSPRLIKLDLCEFNVTDTIAHEMRPVLRHLRQLELDSCTFGGEFLKVLAKYTRDQLDLLSLTGKCSETSFEALTQIFPKLKKLVLFGMNLSNSDIEEILKLNPQLEQIHFGESENLDDDIFQFIAEHVPQIDALELAGVKPTGKKNMDYLGRLRNLKSLNICTDTGRDAPMLDIWNISFVNLPLKSLRFRKFVFGENADRFISALSKSRELEYLELCCMHELTSHHIIDLIKYLSEIRDIVLMHNKDLVLSFNDCLQMFQTANKLKSVFHEYSRPNDQIETDAKKSKKEFHVDVAFNKRVKVVQNQYPQTGLIVYSDFYVVDKIPETTD